MVLVTRRLAHGQNLLQQIDRGGRSHATQDADHEFGVPAHAAPTSARAISASAVPQTASAMPQTARLVRTTPSARGCQPAPTLLSLFAHPVAGFPPEERAALAELVVVEHPLVQHKLTLLRMKQTPVAEFRRLVREIAHLLAYEITRDLPLATVPIETPLTATEAKMLAGKKVCIVSILRAGNGLLEGMLELIPSARVGHIGLWRDPATLQPVEYYYKVPTDIAERPVIVVDPMLATANSAARAVERLKADGARDIKFACLIAAPEGVARMHEAHPDVPIYTGAVDQGLNDHGYILPGLGDAGDRLFGTR